MAEKKTSRIERNRRYFYSRNFEILLMIPIMMVLLILTYEPDKPWHGVVVMVALPIVVLTGFLFRFRKEVIKLSTEIENLKQQLKANG